MIPYVKESTTNVFICPHGGGYKITGSQTKALDGSDKLIVTGDTIAPTGSPAPCAAASIGVPICTFPPAVATSTKKVMNTGKKFMLTTDVQIATNGFPSVVPKITASNKVKGV